MEQIEIAPTTAVAEYSPLAAGLAELERLYRGVVFDCRTTEGDGQARKARKELVTLRTTLEAKRKELKAPALERSRLIDSEAKRIEALIRAVELPIDEQIGVVEREKEAERQRRLDEIAQRVAGIRRQIAEAFSPPHVPLTVAELDAVSARMEGEPITAERFGDLLVEAQEAKCAGLEWIACARAARRKVEEEQADLARQREEIAAERARLTAEKREQDRVEAERQRVAQEAREAEQAVADAERARQAAEAERARVAAQEREDAALVARTRLQMAAPKMLEALQKWKTAEIGGSDCWVDAMRDASRMRDEAIADATGEHLPNRTALLGAAS